ncbi:TPA: TolC family protein, partial [Pseudomonas aeruginosa]|nr:TolC family protein [Pseudomonas aeruginosa]
MKQRKSLVARSTTAALLTLALAGCTLAPTYERPPAPIPNHWQGAGTAPVNTQAAAAELDWNAFVTDDHLRRLIELALDNNRDLRQSLLNVEAARAQYRVQRADRLPSVGVQGSGTRQRVPADLTYSGQS